MQTENQRRSSKKNGIVLNLCLELQREYLKNEEKLQQYIKTEKLLTK